MANTSRDQFCPLATVLVIGAVLHVGMYEANKTTIQHIVIVGSLHLSLQTMSKTGKRTFSVVATKQGI